MSSQLFSIIICAQGKKDIDKTLRSISKQKVSIKRNQIEILVVSSSAEITVKSSTMAACRKKAIFKYYYTPHNGISFLRNISLQRARGKYLCFIDDDIELGRDWFINLFSFINMNQDSQIMFGEIHTLDSQTRKKETWIKKMDAFTPWLVATVSKTNKKSINPYTANVCIRRDVFSIIGRFCEILGNQEGPVSLPYGEDAEFFRRAWRSNIHISFVDKMNVNHYVSPNRSSLPYLLWRYIDNGKNNVVFYLVELGMMSLIEKMVSTTTLLIGDLSSLVLYFPLGILYVVGKKIGILMMIFYIIKHKPYYARMLADFNRMRHSYIQA